MSNLSKVIGKIGSFMSTIAHSINDYSISEFPEANREDILKKIISDIKSAANKVKAQEHRNLNSLRKSQDGKLVKYPLFKSSTWEVLEYSQGFALYFLFIKHLIIIMFLILCASILPLYLNYKGDYLSESEVQSMLDFFTIANIYGVRLNSTDSLDSSKLEKNYQYYWITDACYSIFFLSSIFISFLYSHYSIYQNIKVKNRISDFTVEVTGPALRKLTPENFKNKYSISDKVRDIFIGRNFGDTLPLFKKKAIIKTN